MTNCVLFYFSEHHLNTEKLVMAVAKALPSITAVSIRADSLPDMDEYDLVGFASGIYMGKPHPEILGFIEKQKKKLQAKKVFTLCTSGSNGEKYSKAFHSYLEEQGSRVLGDYRCKGFDTYGPWKIIGGIAKGHPDHSDILNAVSFVKTFLAPEK